MRISLWLIFSWMCLLIGISLLIPGFLEVDLFPCGYPISVYTEIINPIGACFAAISMITGDGKIISFISFILNFIMTFSVPIIFIFDI
jgi:hypothetical protein